MFFTRPDLTVSLSRYGDALFSLLASGASASPPTCAHSTINVEASLALHNPNSRAVGSIGTHGQTQELLLTSIGFAGCTHNTNGISFDTDSGLDVRGLGQVLRGLNPASASSNRHYGAITTFDHGRTTSVFQHDRWADRFRSCPVYRSPANESASQVRQPWMLSQMNRRERSSVNRE